MDTTKIAILRGINVGGKRKILMKDLQQLAASLGWKDVRTYIQSGNILFNSSKPEPTLSKELQQAIKREFDFDVPIIIQSAQELKEAVAQNPFYSGREDINQLHLTFLDRVPDGTQIEKLSQIDTGDDQFEIIGRNIFIFCAGKYHQSKLSNTTIERKLELTATTRNWKTVTKLLELAEQYSS